MKEITDYLEKLDLSEIEAKIYLTLLKTGTISVRKLAPMIDLKRTTAYLNIDPLIEKGLVIKVIKGAQKQISAASPETLQDLIERKVQSAENQIELVKNLEKEYPSILRTIETTFPRQNDTHDAEIRYYKGKAGVRKIYTEALQCSELRLYANISEIVKFLLPKEDEKNLFTEALAKNPKLKIFEMIADSPEKAKKFNLNHTAQKGRYFYKFMPAQIDLNAACILLYDNKVAIINVKEKSSCIILHNSDYYVNSKKLFDFIWTVLPKV